ncbi:MAG: hypothetical protein BWY06_02882 [Candidatus Latescibacteria bacterium ADurb.Bin168]|nr:MAG: hypothetical protein BWY06_02882 [Candidatus Latescibacteria bacterium ADurb.Bin168]
MPELFPDFIVSEESFRQAKEFWRELVREQMAALGQMGDWAPWTHEEAWSSDPDSVDGAVILSVYSASQNKGLRVQQSATSAHKDKKPFVGGYTDIFGEGILERPIPNLCIDAIPADENLSSIKKIVGYWFDIGIDQTAMQAYLKTETQAKSG